MIANLSDLLRTLVREAVKQSGDEVNEHSAEITAGDDHTPPTPSSETPTCPSDIRRPDVVAVLALHATTVDDAFTTIRQTVVRRVNEIGRISSCALALIGLVTWAAIGGPSQNARLVQTDSWFPQLRAALIGHIAPETTLTINIAFFAICATLTVALATRRDSDNGLREQILHGQWRRQVSFIATLVAAASIVSSVFAWTGTKIGSTSVVSATTALFAVLCVLMVTAIAVEVTDADHYLTLRRTHRTLDRLRAWRSRVDIPEIPVPWFGRTHRVIHGYILRPVAVGLVLSFVVVIIRSTRLLINGEDIELWSSAGRFVALTLFAAIWVWVLGLHSVIRLTNYATGHPRWQLTWKPAMLRVLLLAAIAANAFILPGAWWNRLIVGAFLAAPPVCVWVAVCASRRSGGFRWLTQPIWAAAAVRLLEHQARHERSCDRELRHLAQS